MFVLKHSDCQTRLYRHLLSALALLAAGLQAVAAPLDPPTQDTLVEARRIVQEMRQDQRGPYSRIRWFCNDGTVQAPVAYACTERGGGRQHAEYSASRQRLAELGWSVGTIFAALDFEKLFDAASRQQRLRQLPLERYLIDIDDGWVLHRAKGYRGRVQVEDEEVAGRQLLSALLSDAAWANENFLLVREAASTIPHGEDNDLARSVRRKAIQLAELEPSAERWRAEIHSAPSQLTAGNLRRWADRQKREDVTSFAIELANDLDALYGPAGRKSRIETVLARIGKHKNGRAFQADVVSALDEQPLIRISKLCSAMARARSDDFAALPPELRVSLLDALRELESEVQLAYRDATNSSDLTRGDLFAVADSVLQCSYAAGLLSETERAAAAQLAGDGPAASLTLDEYRNRIAKLKRVPGWAIGTVRHTFAEALTRYSALDARAGRFSDDLLRGSSLWILGDVLRDLSKDLDQLSGSVVEINGESVGAAVALNPGIARGTLRVFASLEDLEGATLGRNDIAVIPEAIAELTPVAGILTLGEGNALSHVQLLARNFGIPNVAVDYDALKELEPLADSRVLLVVSSGGDVLLQRDDSAPDSAAAAPMHSVTVPVPQLGKTELLPLNQVRRSMSGKVVGPKAANLGELNSLFPGRVAPAVAIPFGVYAAHLDEAGLTQRIVTAFAGRNDSTLDEDAFNTELASVRRAIEAIELSPAVAAELGERMLAEFGEPGSYGVFVRSDTNVEDLPQFTGAGLNETLPNIVDPAAQLRAVPRVWSSVLSPRALAWRSNVLSNPEQIYASVLLMKSVPASKSGVLVTTNLYDRSRPGLTTSAAWGVGGAVAGEAAETLAITSSTIEVISESKSPYQRRIAATGGVDMIPAPAGRVLTDKEVEILRALAVEVDNKYEAVFDDNGRARPWDIEFGFIDGELTLFQIRPLVERGSGSADALLRTLRSNASDPPRGDMPVAIDQTPGSLK
jgi:hypothetical protein